MTWIQKSPFKFYRDELEDTTSYKNAKLTLKNNAKVDINLLLLLLPCQFLKELLEDCQECPDVEIIMPDVELDDVKRLQELLLRGKTKWRQTIGFLELVYDMLRFDEKTFTLDDTQSPVKRIQKLDTNLKKQNIDQRQTFKVIKSNCCKYCLKYFPRLDQLKTHIMTNHIQKKNTTNKFKCKQCNSEFNTKAGLKSHELSHEDDQTYDCPSCKKSYATYNNLQRHLKSKHHTYPKKGVYPKHEIIVKEGNEECDICHRIVGRIEHHKRKHHSEESRKFKCQKCDYTTDRSDLIRKHELRRHKIAKRDFEAIDKTFENQDVDWACFDCNQSFDSEVEIENHTLLRNCEEIACKICHKKFKEKWNLKQHLKNVHEDPQKFKCNRCSKLYSYKSSLTKHMKKCK